MSDWVPFASDPHAPAPIPTGHGYNWKAPQAPPTSPPVTPKITGKQIDQILDTVADADLGPISKIAKNNMGRLAIKGFAKYAMAPEHKQLMIGGGLAAGGALLTNIFDDKDHSVMGTARDMAVAAGLEIATDKAIERFGMSKAHLIAQAMVPQEMKGTVGALVKESMKHHASKPILSKGTTTGAVVGGIIGAVSGDRDGMGSVVDAAIGAGAGYGIGALVEQWSDHSGGFKGKGIKVKDVAKAATEEEAREMAIQKSLKINRMKGKAAVGIAALIGVGALVSTRNSLDHEVNTDMQVAEQEKRITRKTNNDNEAMSEMFGWNQNVNMGQLAIDMFNDRIGHHLMGNAKFK